MATTFIPFYIILTDGGVVLENQINFPSGRVMSPVAAGIEFGASIAYAVGSGVPPPNNFSPRIGVPPLPSGSLLNIGIESATYGAGQVVDDDGVLHPLAGAPGGTIEWRGFFFTEIPNAGTEENLQTVRFICGFEIPTQGDGGSGNANHFSRDASRTTDGKGYAFRKLNNEAKTFVPGVVTKTQWDRFYMRPRTRPTAGNEYFYFTHASAEGGSNFLLAMTPTGSIAVYNKGNQAFPGTLIGTIGAQDLNKWFKLDIVFAFSPDGVAPGTFAAWVNGAQVLALSVTAASGGGGGLATSQNLSNTNIGNEGQIASNGGEMDFDDWSGRSVPSLFTGLDWTKGTHTLLLMPTAFDPGTSVNWTGDYRILEGNPVAGQFATDHVDNAVNNSDLKVTSNYADYQKGCAAIQPAIYALSSAGGNVTLGYSASGGSSGSVTQALAQGQWCTKCFSLGGVAAPVALGTVTLTYNPLLIGAQQIWGFQGTAEFIGTFGPEDDTSALLPVNQGHHNAPYWDQPVGSAFIAPTSPVELMSGTYTGNGTGQDISVSVPIHWWFSRPLTGASASTLWWSTLLAGHDHDNALPKVNRFIRAFRTPASGSSAGSYTIQISGADAQSNANGVVYQWVGFSDQGLRFLLNQAGAHVNGDLNSVNNLADGGFTPEGAFLFLEALSGSATKSYWKGPGNLGNAADPLTSSENASVAAFGTGTLTSRGSNLNTDSPQFAFAAWRTTDGSGDAGRPVAITSYVGDGTGNRTIALLLNGRFPHFALVSPHTGTAFFRDPSHTGTTSSQVDGTAVPALGIRGGASNAILVGASLNTNLTTYEVFVLAGDATGAGSGGWSVNPTAGNPIFTVDTIIRSGDGPFAPTDTKGWWMSTNKFTGSATLITNPMNPKHPRHWDKISGFATGAAAHLGGSPGAGVTYNNHMFYAGDDYTVDSSAPQIRTFDGTSDRLFVSVPPVSGTTPTKAIISMILVGTKIYFSTYDSGTTSANFSGRVFELDILSANIVQLGTAFSGGELPYTLVWHMDRLWLGTNKTNGTAGKIYYFRPDIDVAWTTDKDLGTIPAGGACSMASFGGSLYIGCDAAAAVAAKVVARDSLGVYTTSDTAATTAQNNGYLSLLVFGTSLYAGYWNPSTAALIRQFNGTAWATVYTGVGTGVGGTIRPYIGMFQSDGVIFVVGGGSSLQASLVSSSNGSAWSDNTPFLTGPVTETALPIFGSVGT